MPSLNFLQLKILKNTKMDKSHLSKICATGIGFAIAYLASRVLENKNKKESSFEAAEGLFQQKQQQKRNNKQLQKLCELKELLNHKSQQFQIERLPGNNQILSKQCILKFMWETIDLVDSEEIIELLCENRTARRKTFIELFPEDLQTVKQERDSVQEGGIKPSVHQCETYFRFVCTLDESIKYILEKSQKDLAAFIGLDYSEIIESIEYHSDGEHSDTTIQFRIRVMEVMSSIRDSLHQHLPLYATPASTEQIKKALVHQIELVREKREFILELVRRIGLECREEEQALPILLTSIIDDYIFDKLRVESEQLSMGPDQMSEEIVALMGEFKRRRDELIEEMHNSVQDNILLNGDSHDQYDD